MGTKLKTGAKSLHAILVSTLIIAQLGVVPAQADPASNRARIPDPANGAAGRVNAPTGTATNPDNLGTAAPSGTQRIASNPTPPAPVGPRAQTPATSSGVLPVGTRIAPITIEVDPKRHQNADGTSEPSGSAKQYTFEGIVSEASRTEAGISGDGLQPDADGVYRAIPQSSGPQLGVAFHLKECSDGSCDKDLFLKAVNGIMPTQQQIQDFLRIKAKQIDTQRRKAARDQKRRENCELLTVYDKDGEEHEVSIKSDDDAKKYRTAILECNLDQASDDSFNDHDDGDDDDTEKMDGLTLGEVSGPKIGGVLRRNMVSDTQSDREWAIARLQDMSKHYTNGDVGNYIRTLLKGALQIDFTFRNQNLSFANPNARQAINQEFENAAQAWQMAAMRYMNQPGSQQASIEVYELLKAKGCAFVNETMSTGMGQHQQCTSIDAAVQDGNETTPISLPNPDGSVAPHGSTARATRVQNNGAPGSTFNGNVNWNNQYQQQRPINGNGGTGFRGQMNYQMVNPNQPQMNQPLRGGGRFQ